MLILVAALAGALVLCAGGGVGGWLLLRDPDRDGAATPSAAVQSFLQAVYRDQDPAAAAELVCSEARDQGALATKIDELREYQEAHVEPSFQWSDPAPVDETEELSTVAVTVSMITGDEKMADQTLHISVLDKDPHGWWVCNLETVADPSAEDQEPDEDGDSGEDGGEGEGDDADDADDADDEGSNG